MRLIALFCSLLLLAACIDDVAYPSGDGTGSGLFYEISTLETRDACYSILADYDRLYLADGNAGLTVADVSIIEFPNIMEYSTLTNGTAWEFALQENRWLWMACGNGGVVCYDLNSFGAMVPYVTLNLNDALGLYLSGTTLWVADGYYGVKAFDVSTPLFASQVGGYAPYGRVTCVGGYDDKLYIGGDFGLEVVTTEWQGNSWLISHEQDAGIDPIYNLAIEYDRLYTCSDYRLTCWQIDNLGTVTETSHLGIPYQARQAKVQGNYIWLSCQDGLRYISASNPYNISEKAHLRRPTPGVYGVEQAGRYIFLARGAAGMEIIRYER